MRRPTESEIDLEWMKGARRGTRATGRNQTPIGPINFHAFAGRRTEGRHYSDRPDTTKTNRKRPDFGISVRFRRFGGSWYIPASLDGTLTGQGSSRNTVEWNRIGNAESPHLTVVVALELYAFRRQ